MTRRIRHSRAASPVGHRSAVTPHVWWALILACALFYANSLDNPFVIDDQQAIVENDSIRTLTPLSVPLSPPSETPVARRPLVNLSFALDYARSGIDASAFRQSNLAIHLMTGLLLLSVVRRALRIGATPDLAPHASVLAGVVALLWAVHPLQTEVVNYISQRTTSLMSACYLLTLYCAIRALDGNRRWQVGAVAACAAGMACKESMVTAPVVVILFERVFVFSTLRQAIRAHGWFYGALAATWVGLAMLIASGGRTTVGFDAGVSASSYLLNQLPILLDYLGLVVWPRALVVDYGLPRELSVGDVWAPALMVVSLGVFALLALRFRPQAGFLLTSFFVLLAPTSSVIPIVTEVGAERRMYLPLAALLVLIVCTLFRAGASWLRHPSPMRTGGVTAAVPLRVLGTLSFVVVVLLLGARTVARNAEYQTPRTLAETNVVRRPHGRSLYTLGHALFEDGNRREALEYFRQSSPEFPAADFALGSELLVEGQIDEGILALRRFVDRVPDHPAVSSARQTIAASLATDGRTDEAIAELRDILTANTRLPRAQSMLGRLLLLTQEPAAAVPHLEAALAARPADAAVRKHLARALGMAGDYANARAVLERGAMLHPEDAEIRDLLGVVMAYGGDLQAARRHFTEALVLDPSSESARRNLSRAERVLSEPCGLSCEPSSDRQGQAIGPSP